MYSHCIRRQNNLPKLERLCVLRKGLGTVAERKLNMKTKIASKNVNVVSCWPMFNFSVAIKWSQG